MFRRHSKHFLSGDSGARCMQLDNFLHDRILPVDGEYNKNAISNSHANSQSPQMSFSANGSIFLRFFVYMLPMLLQIFLPCQSVNELTSSSEKLATRLFHSQWIDGGKSLQSSAIICMENLKHPIRMQALKVFEIDLEKFVSICRFSYSFYAVLQSFKT